MPPLDPLTTPWADLGPAWWAGALALIALGLWGNSRRVAELRRRRAAEAPERAGPGARRPADLPRAAPGEWQVRCTRCQGTMRDKLVRYR